MENHVEKDISLCEPELDKTDAEMQAASTAMTCEKCGAKLEYGQQYCPKCGNKSGIGTSSVASKAKGKKIAIFIGVCAVIAIAVVVLILFLQSKKFDFNKEYGGTANYDWCTIGSDGTWMKLDTNPDDIDEDEFTYSDYTMTWMPCYEMIEEVNADLGFSSAVYEKMGQTTWSQGRQTESNDKFTVSWTYHPDKGLEVMYEVNN